LGQGDAGQVVSDGSETTAGDAPALQLGEIRISKLEIRNKFKSSNDRMTKTEARFRIFFLEHSVIVSNFVLRISSCL
jgi:hypothetical protein